MTSRWARLFSWITAGAVAATAAAGCSAVAPAVGGVSTSPKGPPIVIGTSLPLTGAFAPDGQASRRGYELWAQDVNTAGGLLGRPVRLTILNDNSDPATAQADYTKLIRTDHVPLILGPFSSLLTGPSAVTVGKYGYAMVEGSGGAPSVFQTEKKHKLHNVFATSIAVSEEMVPFADWVAHMPASVRPRTAAYPTVDDPFAYPPVDKARSILTPYVHTVFSKKFKEDARSNNEERFYKNDAQQVVKSGAQMVVLGSTDVGTVAAFMRVFENAHYNPKIFIAASGPDQGQAFLNAVGQGNSNGVMVPNGWYGGEQNPLSKFMVENYIAKYGGQASGINADAAEAYSAGEVLADAVKGTHSTSNAKIISYLHRGLTFPTVQGSAKFDDLGRNISGTIYIFQWKNNEFVQVLPQKTLGSVKPLFPKPPWTG